MIESVRPECNALSGLDTCEAGPRMQVSQPSRTKDRRESLIQKAYKYKYNETIINYHSESELVSFD